MLHRPMWPLWVRLAPTALMEAQASGLEEEEEAYSEPEQILSEMTRKAEDSELKEGALYSSLRKGELYILV